MLKHIAALHSRGWYSGDLHVHRATDQTPLLTRAEDIHIAPMTTWWNNRNVWDGVDPPQTLLRNVDATRFFHVMVSEDKGEGGPL